LGNKLFLLPLPRFLRPEPDVLIWEFAPEDMIGYDRI
jgi:hypothetical protein